LPLESYRLNTGAINILTVEMNGMTNIMREYEICFIFEILWNFCKLFLLQVFLLIIFLLTFAFPTIILIFTYGSTGIALKRHITPGNANNVRDKAIFNTKVKVWINAWLHILSIDSDAHGFISSKISSLELWLLSL
jgi:hypothetical protein